MNGLEQIKKQVHSKGFNISMMINKFKKSQRDRKALYEIPEEVYILVCEEILEKLEHYSIKQPWPYFMKVLTLKSHEHFANKNQKEHKDKSFNRKMPESLRAIMHRS